MYSPGDVVINDVHAHFLQLFAEVPGEMTAYSQYLAFVCLRRLGMRKWNNHSVGYRRGEAPEKPPGRGKGR